MKTFDLSNDCSVELDDNKVIVKGDLLHFDQLTPLESALEEVSTQLKKETPISIDLVNSEDCISFLLKPFLRWLRSLPTEHPQIKLTVGSEDGEVLPWHQTVEQYLRDYNPGTCRINIEKIEL